MRLLVLVCIIVAAAVPARAQFAYAQDVPEWLQRAVWYQIFPERFRNGDPTNDPTIESIEGSWPQAGNERLREAGWQITPWTQDWYRQEPWAQFLGEDFYYTVQLRRFGGDLQGVLEALPYLDSLGINAIYFNPLNDAPSLHKYDARDYRHIDPHFGPDPDGDRAIIAGEDRLDPNTWRFTSADLLFLDVVREARARGIRVVMDYSWNHTGKTHWAWLDVLENQRESRFAPWYEIESFDDPATPENEFAYSGWAGVRELPELRKIGQTGNPHDGVPYDGNLHPEVRDHVFAVTRRWMDPHGNGSLTDGIDGFRLDVAEMVPLGFWRDYRALVKEINPEAVLVGEIWWQNWPDRMMDPRPYLEVFDSVMNYRWYMPTRGLIAGGIPAETPTSFVAHLDSISATIPIAQRRAMMNMASGHDSPRLATSLQNRARRYKVAAVPSQDADYDITAPTERTRRDQRLLVLQQFTWEGSPHIFYGEEAGMWGADDPDMRKPMLWPEMTFEDEATHPRGRERTPDVVAFDHDLFDFYREMARMRHEHEDVFAAGETEWLLADDEAGLLAYRRWVYGGEAAIIVFNLSENRQTIDLVRFEAGGMTIRATVGEASASGNELLLAPRSAVVLISPPGYRGGIGRG
ncbi:glycoside hydrolase family 13 protein [soil metagenome]